MRRLLVLPALATTACSFQLGSGGTPSGDGGTSSDARPNDGGTTDSATADAGPATCFGPSTPAFRVCLPLPPGPQTLGSQVIDTTACALGAVVPQNTGPALCVVAGTTLDVTGTVRGQGDRPLVLLATAGALTIASGAIVDVSSSEGMPSGAGADDPACAGGSNGGSAGPGGGGGGGGSFGTSGGAGGGGGGAGGGSPTSTGAAQHVRGGCRGTRGGAGAGTGGAPGAGGGAVYLVSSGPLVITGQVNASGAGGSAPPGSAKDGGGGGGSGGLIALFAAGSLTINGELFANGGGGAGGTDPQNTAGPGGESPDAGTAGAPGAAGGAGGQGGDGAISTNGGGGGGGSSRGGGGGGGGVGVIKRVSPGTIGGSPTLSPPAS